MSILNKNLIINQIVLNKSKDKSIIFIHGFYANAGYWLPYLSFFKNYKIILLDINYVYLLNSDDRISEIIKVINSLNLGGNIKAILGHSLGTIISSFINKQSVSFYFDICPVSYSNRSDTNGFINDIIYRMGETEFNIRKNLYLVDLLINESKVFRLINSHLFIPDSDKYFNYEYSNNIEYSFQGDHFEITNAVIKISNLLEE